MCWRDNQRDWGGENARRKLNRNARNREGRGNKWALTATMAQKRAAKSVDLLYELLRIEAFDRRFDGIGAIGVEVLHAHFPVFAAAAGLRGQYYSRKRGVCRAVVFHGLLAGYGPRESYMHISSSTHNRESSITKCLEICKELNFRWNEKSLITGAQGFVTAKNVASKKASQKAAATK